MCDPHEFPHKRFHRFAPFMRMMCGPFGEPSKETAIKDLEAMKSRLEDYIKYIDERIAELQKKEKASA